MLSGMDFVTTAPAPTITFFPMVTPGRMMHHIPMNVLSLMVIAPLVMVVSPSVGKFLE